MKHPEDIEAIIRLVDVYGHSRLVSRLREYMQPLVGEPPAPFFAGPEIQLPPEGLRPGDVVVVANEDTKRLDFLEKFAPHAGAKRRLQIFFGGTLREWIDTKIQGK